MSDQTYERRPLGSAIARHIGGGTPPRHIPSYWKGDIPWASVKDFSDDEAVIAGTQECITRAGLNASASNLIPAGTPLVCTRMAVGRAALSAVPMAINQDVKALFPAAGVSPSYLLKMIRYIQPMAEGQAVGSTVKGIRVQEYLSIQVPLAPIEHQPQIARVLDTLDTAIRETEAIISKLKAVKQGLLHDLLTRGIDANGELRPSHFEAPHLYKQSSLGWIPKDWEEVSLGQIAERSNGLLQTGPFGAQLHAHEYVADGIPVIMPQDMVDCELSIEHIARITEHKATSLARHRLQKNDIVFSRRGDLSRCVAIEDEQFGWVCGTGCLLARFPSREINGFWLALVYPQRGVQAQVMGRAVGSTMANLNTSILSKIKIARPTVAEQDEVAVRVKMVAQRLASESLELKKMKLEKVGLMDDLLTGHVRVTPLLSAPQ